MLLPAVAADAGVNKPGAPVLGAPHFQDVVRTPSNVPGQSGLRHNDALEDRLERPLHLIVPARTICPPQNLYAASRPKPPA